MKYSLQVRRPARMRRLSRERLTSKSVGRDGDERVVMGEDEEDEGGGGGSKVGGVEGRCRVCSESRESVECRLVGVSLLFSGQMAGQVDTSIQSAFDTISSSSSLLLNCE
jgi:hypothetical protein